MLLRRKRLKACPEEGSDPASGPSSLVAARDYLNIPRSGTAVALVRISEVESVGRK
jgi:hypothetical protein